MPPLTGTRRYGTVDAGPHAATIADGFDYTYDDVGNLTVADDGDTVTNYTYNVRNQLIAVDGPGTDDLTMVYDPDGSRVTRTEGPCGPTPLLSYHKCGILVACREFVSAPPSTKRFWIGRGR